MIEMSEHTILVLNNPAARNLAVLAELPGSPRIVAGDTPEAFAKAAADADILLVGGAKRALVETVFAMAPNLKWVHSQWAGLDGLMFPALADSPVLLTNGAGVFAEALGEFGIAAILWFAKDLDRMRRQQAERRWEEFNVHMISGARLGVIGLGGIGKAVARRALALGMHVHGLGRKHSLQEFESLLRESDYLLLSAPLTPETRGMLGRREFNMMKPGSILLNLGRGAVADEAALLAALRSGPLRGAALDVFHVEPLPQDHPLWAMENVLISPHTADHTSTWLEEATRFFVRNYARYVNGEPLENLVDKKAGY
jgi:phosphoglycerate dehydrogenase-like enzyme